MKPARSIPPNPRAAAAQALAQVMVRGRYLDRALEAALATAPPEAALVQELAYGTLRWFHQLAGIAALLLEKPLKPKDQDVYALLL
ncbi:MAG: transcription antitermination factor NusB, partial [Pseudomonadota bacterium]